MILLIIAAGLISRPTLAQANFADQVVCSSGVVDYEDAGWNNGGYSIDVEQSACISYSDGDGFDPWVETDDDYGEVFYDEYWSYNQYVTGVGAEAQMSYLDPNNGNSIVVSDSGMNYANWLGTAYAPASYTGQPQLTGYVLQGYYSEENLQGVWSDVAYGISLEMGMLLIPNITVSTSGTPSAVGQPVTFTATVNNTSGPAPTGDICFVILSLSSSGGDSSNSTAISGTTATYTTNALPAGTYDIYVVYSGDSNYIYGQVGNYFHQVVSTSLTAPTLSLTTSSASSTAGHPVMFTANISSGATGVVNFLVDGTVIGSRTITGNSATFTTSALTLGTHSISANYSGNQNYSAASSNNIIQVVTYALQPSGTIDYSYTITPTGGPSGYSSNGNLLSYTDSVNGTWSNIAYDGLNRLSAATQVPVGGVAQSYCWTYDSFGNRTTEATSNQPFVNAPGAATCQVASGATLTGNAWTSYTVNGADQGNNRVVATSAGSYQPDAAGNILSDGVNGYTYDGEGRLCAVAVPQYTGGVILTQYIYDAEGTRVAKGTNTNLNAGCDTSGTTFTLTNTYIIGSSGEQLTETDGSGNWLHTNVYAVGKLLATYSYTDSTHTATDTYFALSDWLGTKRAVVSAGGCGTGYVSLPYGDSLTPSSLPGFTQCPDATENHFTGKERDAESGKDYFGKRYYASSMGRWMSPDRVTLTDERILNPANTLNLYTYGANNPLKYVDPDGQDITYFYDQGGIAGHAILFAYNQATGDSAVESFGPGVHAPVWKGESNFDMDNYKSADDLRSGPDGLAALTIQTSPETTQEVINYIRTNPDPALWWATGPNCSTQCDKILQKFKLDYQKSLVRRNLTPKFLWHNLMSRYNPGQKNETPQIGRDYGQPESGLNMFDLLWDSINPDNFQVSTRQHDNLPCGGAGDPPCPK